MKIALVIPGRFHGFDLARALLARGHAVTVLTNYPRWAVRRFGVPDERVRSFVTHGVASRVLDRLPGATLGRWTQPAMHRLLGTWAARTLAGEPWDVIHGWSGVSEEFLRSSRVRCRVSLLMRGSAHIVEQGRLLEEEERRSGVPLDRPSAWMTARELREYELTGHIGVLSTFALESFVAKGVSRDRLCVVPPGVEVAAFRPDAQAREARRSRILGPGRLKVLYVGTVSLRKGLLDFAAAIDQLEGAPMEFTFVGPILPEARQVVERLRGRAAFVGKVPQERLATHYAGADLFVFPTIEDGFGVVLAQAKAAGLPVVTTPNSAGADLVTDGDDGWLVPIRDAKALAARLRAIEGDRPALERVARRAADVIRPSSWSDAAAVFETACAELLRRSAEDGK
jgi:glycosyltransferase involved in cell wall biosynthesis